MSPLRKFTGRVATTIQELLGKAASGEAAGARDGRANSPLRGVKTRNAVRRR